MDPLSISASIAGLISITDMIAGRSYKYIKEARGASKEVKKLLEEITDLFGILNSLRLVASRYQDEAFDSTLQSQHIHNCHILLEKIKDRLDKADPSQVDETKSSLRQKASSLSRTLNWPFSSAETKGLIAEVANQKATLSLALAADGMNTLIESLSQQKVQGEDIVEIRENIRAQRAEQALSSLSNERKKILDTIGSFDPSGHQNIAINLRQPGTGVFFTEGPQFKHWLETPNAKLWLYGIPGAGKTVLTSSIVQAASNQAEPEDGIAYFYCDYKDSKTHDPLIILGAIVRQLAIQNPRCLHTLEKFYALYYLESRSITGPSITPESLCSLIQSLSAFFDQVMIIVDALDECGNDRSKVVELLASLNVDGSNIKTLFTSRLETDIELHLHSYEKVSIAATSSDLRLYVASEIESRSRKKLLRTRDPDLKREIMDRLVDGAEGMFRWVACQMDYLCELNTDKAIRKALNSLPPTLFATYERILDRVNASNADTQQLVRMVLTWIICSKEPLSTKQLLEAVSISEGDTELDPDAMPDEEGILKWCSSLVRRTPDGDVLELAHFTVEEFLEAIDDSEPNNPYARYKIIPEHQNLPLAKLCLTYLLFSDFEDNEWSGENEKVDFTTKYNFYSYSSDYWAEHALAHRDDEQLLDLVKIMFDPSKTGNFLCWSRFWMSNLTLDNDPEPISNTETLHFAAALSFYDICKWLLEEEGRTIDLDKLSTVGTPLYCALTAEGLFDDPPYPSPHGSDWKIVDQNRRRTVECLLNAGARIDNIRVHPHLDWTPLTLTLNIDFCWDLLLERGAILDEFSLEEAEKMQNEKLDVGEKFLLKISENNIDEHIRPKYVNVALRFTNTREQAVKMMSTADGATSNVSLDDSSALCKAAEMGQIHIVKELLNQRGIDIDFRDPKRKDRTALHWSCKNGHFEVVKVLIERGASIEVADIKGKTPLFQAASADYLDVVQYLEAKGSDINTITNDGRTVLHLSAAKNSASTLKHFLQSPRLTHSLSTRTKNGRNVLQCAVEYGALETTRFILQMSSRSEILNKSDDGYTCLHYAVLSATVRIISLFQDSGICHYDQTSDGFTALHYAANEPDAQLFGTLLDLIDRVTLNTDIFAYPTLLEARTSLQCSNGTWNMDDFVSGRRLDILTTSGKTALQILLLADPFRIDHAEMVEDLASRDSIDLERRDKEKKTPLVALASRLSRDSANGYLCQAMKKLLYRRVDPNAQDIFGRTALHYLCNPTSFSVWIFQAIVALIEVDGLSEHALLDSGPRMVLPSPPRPTPNVPVVVETRPGGDSRRPPGSPGPPGPPPPPPPYRQPPKARNVRIVESTSNKSCIARVDVWDQTKETALQAFFRNLNRTHNPDQATKIASRMLSLSEKDEIDQTSPNGNRLLNLAIEFKNDELIQELCKRGVNTEERDSTIFYRSPLEQFCIHGVRDIEILRKLIKACKNLGELDSKGLSLLHLASDSGHIKIVKELIDGGLDVNIRSTDGVPALSHAVDAGHTSIVELLLDNGAKIDELRSQTQYYMSSLASRVSNVATCRLLDERGISDWTEKTECIFYAPFVPGFTTTPGVQSRAGVWLSPMIRQLTPLHHIALRGYLDVVTYVIEHGKDVDIDAEAAFGIRPLFVTILGRRYPVVRYLLAQGAKTDAVYTPTQWSLLHLAAHIGDDGIVELLLEHGADPSAKDVSGLTPSIIALQQGHLDISIMLEDAEKLQPNDSNSEPTVSQDGKISPALEDAISKGDLKLCQQLIGRGFSIDGTCECGCTPLLKACANSRLEVAAYLVEIGASVDKVACLDEDPIAGCSALHIAALDGDLELFKKILKRNPDVSENGVQPIHLAARKERLNVLQFILEGTKDKKLLLEAKTPKIGDFPDGYYSFLEDLRQACPLHVAVRFWRLEAAESLLRAGADIEARDEIGQTAMHLAVRRYHKDILSLLVVSGANLNAQDNEGVTPLMVAAKQSKGKGVRDLISMAQMGLDLQATDIDGRTALHHAVEYGELRNAKLLVKAGLDPSKADIFEKSPIHIALYEEYDPFPLHNLPAVDTFRSKIRGTLLNNAAFMGNEAVVTELLKRIPVMDTEEYVNFACGLGTPLSSAASCGNISIMEKLFEKGAQINAVGGPFGSPLIAACTKGQAEAVAWLLRRGAELHCTKTDSTTITAEEAAHQHENVLFVLRSFREKGVEGLDEEVPIKTADISKLDEFMIAYKERKEKGVEDSSDGSSSSDEELDDGTGLPKPPSEKKDDTACDEESSKKDDEKASEERPQEKA